MNESADALTRIMRALQSDLGVPAGVNAFIRALDQKVPVADLITHLRALRRYSEPPSTASKSLRCCRDQKITECVWLSILAVLDCLQHRIPPILLQNLLADQADTRVN